MKKTRWLLYVVFGLVFYLLFLVIEMPASWFAWGLNRYTQGSVRLDPIAGSLWGGKGRLVIYYPQTTPHDFGLTEWRINPFWLFTGRFQFSLQTNNQDRQIKATFGVTKSRFMLKETDATIPADLVARLYPPASLLSPQGKVRLSAPELAVTPGNLEGTAILEWQNAASSLSSVQPLGDYRLEMTGAGSNANLKLTTLRGSLELTGQGQWQAKTGQIQMTGSAVARERAGELESLLQLMGNDQGGGRRALVLNVPLTPAMRAAPTPSTPSADPSVKSQ